MAGTKMAVPSMSMSASLSFQVRCDTSWPRLGLWKKKRMNAMVTAPRGRLM